MTDRAAEDGQRAVEGRASSAPGAPPATGWLAAVGVAAARTVARPGLWPFALLAFLVRGGIIVMLAPIVVVPTFVGLATYVSPTSVTAAGPTPRLLLLIVAAVGAAAAAALAGTVAAAAAETALHRATVAAEGDDPASSLLPPRTSVDRGRGTILSVAVVRLVMLVPVVLVLAVAAPTYVGVAYQELLLPTDPGMPFPVRVVLGAAIPSVLLGITWLVGEIIGGLAARRIILLGQGIVRALGSAIVDVAVAPLTALATLVLGLVGGLAVLVPGLIVTGLAWGGARDALIDSRHLDQVLGATLLLAVAWLTSFVLAALSATWRAALWTAEFARRPRLPGSPQPRPSDSVTSGAAAGSAAGHQPLPPGSPAVQRMACGGPWRHWYTPTNRRWRPSLPSRRLSVRG